MKRSLVVLALLAGSASAAPHKVLVLPLDGTAPAATRKKLSASFQKMARILEGDVQAGNTSLDDTATAIGCAPEKPACVENVRATLGVDELVYGTADEDNGQVTVVAKRYKRGKQPAERTVTVLATDPPGKVESDLLPVFSNEPLPETTELTPSPTPSPSPSPSPSPEPSPSPSPAVSHVERNLDIGIVAGGGVVLLLGLALWAEKSSLQDDIDSHATTTVADFQDLQDLEDKASSRGWAGNIFVVAGLAIAGYGSYRLWKYYRTSRVTVAPTPVDGGAGVTLTFVGW